MVQELEEDYPRIVSKTTSADEVEMTEQEEATVKIRRSSCYKHHLEMIAGLPNGNVIMLSKKTYFEHEDPEYITL